MSKKKLNVLGMIALGLTLLFCFSACYPVNRPSEETSAGEKNTSGEDLTEKNPEEDHMKLVNQMTLENLPKSEKVKELKDLTLYTNGLYVSFTHKEDRLLAIKQRSSDASARFLYLLQDYHETWPVEYMQKVDDTHLLVVYSMTWKRSTSQTELPASRDMYAYVVFEKTESESWELTTEYYMSTKALSSKDFESLTIGASAADAEEIEPAVLFDRIKHAPYAISESISPENYRFSCWLLLSDGVLVLDFVGENLDRADGTVLEMSDFVLTSKTFHPYGSVSENFSVLGCKTPIELPE